MAFTRVTKDAGVISALHNKPNTSDGLTPAALKAKFDELGAALKAYLNDTLCAELEDDTGAAGAANIGFHSAEGILATTVAEALDELKNDLVGATVGNLPAGSVKEVTLYDLAVTTAKIAEKAVTTAKIYDEAVTAAKLAADAVETAKIKGGAVTTDKLAGTAVTAEKLGAKAVKTTNLADDLVVPLVNGGLGVSVTDDASKASARTALGAQKEIVAVPTFSLTVAGWNGGTTQPVSITGMTASSNFIASPSDAASWDAAADAGLKPPTAGSGTLTFTCDTTPDDPISVTVYWW